MPEPIKMAVIGCGRWGPNHARTIDEHPDCDLVACVDRDEGRRTAMMAKFGVPCFDDAEMLSSSAVWQQKGVDAVVVATPTGTHEEVVTYALRRGIDVLCEKPLSVESEVCARLGNCATENDRILMVGHIFLCNDGIHKLHSLMKSGDLGEILYADCERTNLGPVRYDVGASADLATHDLSILRMLFDSDPEVRGAVGLQYLQADVLHEDAAFINLMYGDVPASIRVSWVDALKVRRIKVVGSKKTAIWDDLGTDGPIKIYDRGLRREATTSEEFGEFKLVQHSDDITIPRVSQSEPLRNQLEEFIECVRSRYVGYSDAKLATSVARSLEEIGTCLAK